MVSSPRVRIKKISRPKRRKINRASGMINIRMRRTINLINRTRLSVRQARTLKIHEEVGLKSLLAVYWNKINLKMAV